MNSMVVGVADCRCSADTQTQLVTYALGSCIGVCAYDPASGVGGLLHFLLPESKMDPEKAKSRPAMFADTGIALLLGSLERLGADKRRLKVRLAGGAQMMDHGRVLNIGKRNYLAARKVLWQQGLMLEMEAVGGTASRNLGLDLSTGEFWVRSHEASPAQTREAVSEINGISRLDEILRRDGAERRMDSKCRYGS